MILIIDILLSVMAVYLLLGLLFSVYFYAKGGQIIDEGLKGTPWSFKAIIFPGVILFWSVLLVKIIKK